MDEFFIMQMPLFFKLFFAFVFGMILFTIIKGIKEWSYNNSQPVLDVEARVVSKRTKVSRRAGGDNIHHSTYTTYYVTFEVDSGDRMEIKVPGKEYGMISEGDNGKLKFQGRRFLNFDRNR